MLLYSLLILDWGWWPHLASQGFFLTRKTVHWCLTNNDRCFWFEEIEVCITEKVRELKTWKVSCTGCSRLWLQAVGCCHIRSMKRVKFPDIFIYLERKHCLWSIRQPGSYGFHTIGEDLHIPGGQNFFLKFLVGSAEKCLQTSDDEWPSIQLK